MKQLLKALISALRIMLCLGMFASAASAAEEVLLAKGELLKGDVSGGAGGWQINGTALNASEVLWVRLSPEPPPSSLAAGVFIRGGSLLTGALLRWGVTTEISSNALGLLPLKRDEVTGSFSPLPFGQAENVPELSRYASLAGAAFGSPGAFLKPGQRCRLRLVNQEEMPAENILLVDSEQVLAENKDKLAESTPRRVVRTIEIAAPPPKVPNVEEARGGPDIVARLKNGDLIRGRLLKLDGQTLSLRTAFAGERELKRAWVAVLFNAGGPATGVTWLSSQTPVKAVQTPLLDGNFPARMDASVNGNPLMLGGLPCERGIGAHSRSELEFALSGAPARFVSLCGIDDETHGRGQVLARVLADGKEVWKSPPLSAKDGVQTVAVDLGNAKTLALQVDFGPNGDDSGGHFDWGWAAVINK